MSTLNYAVPIRRLINEASVPTDFITASDSPIAPLLDKLFFTNYTLITTSDGIGLMIELVVAGEAALGFPGVEDLAVVFGTTDAGATLLDASFFVGPKGIRGRVDNVTVGLRFPPGILKPVPESPGATVPPYAQIEVHGGISLDENFDVHFDGFDSLSLKPVMIGNSGIIISADDVKFDFSRTETLAEIAAAGFDESFMGVYISEAKVTLPKDFPSLAPQDLVLKNCVIGSGGVSGKLEAHYAPVYDSTSKTFSGNGAGRLFGIPFGLKDIELEFKQNTFLKSEIIGKLLLPFFDEPVEVDIGISLDGGFTVKLTSAGPNGLFKLTKQGVLEIELDSIGFELKDGVFLAKLSGEITPLFGKNQGLTWPGFKVQELSIDSKGHVKLQGGWLDLPKQYALNFHGFKVSITKLGMGRNEDGTKWIGFSGSVKLVSGLPAGASVEGLRITANDDWTQPKISFNGVGLELDAKAFYFKGAIAYREFLQNGATVRRFDGDIKLKLRSLKLEIDGSLVVGSVTKTLTTPAYNFFAIYVGVDLPTGIAFGTTGLAFFGFGGLLAIEMEPDKKADQPWYAIDPAPSWYKTPTVGVADLKKWVNAHGSKAFGAAVKFGTFADNGFTVNGRLLVAIVFPGPMVFFEGMLNLLKDRAELTTGDPLFRALAVLDNRAGSLLIGVDVKYQYDKDDGKLLKIAAGTEAYYQFNDPRAWHIYLGIKEPREQRIQADILSLFNANAYLMLNAHQLAMGAWVGLDKSWNFGPLSVTLQAWMETNAVLSFKPAHLSGNLWVHGAVDLKAFSFGLGLTIDARLEADVFDPFHVLGQFDVALKLPWPFRNKTLEAHVQLEWGPKKVQPAIPIALKEVTIEHFKTSTTWPLPASSLLVPDYAGADGFLLGSLPTPDELAGPPVAAPIVPTDGRPSIAFARNVNDDALIGAPVQPLTPEWERIGDPTRNEGPAEVRYALKEVRLDKWNGSAWQPVAGKGTNMSGLAELYGTWTPVPGGSGIGQNTLLLWSTCGFNQLRHTGTEWSDWFSAQYGGPDGYPCIPDAPPSHACLDFENIESWKVESRPTSFAHPDHLDVTFAALADARLWLDGLPVSFEGKTKMLGTEGATASLQINFAVPVSNIHITAVNRTRLAENIEFYVTDAADVSSGPFLMTTHPTGAEGFRYQTADIAQPDVKQVLLTSPFMVSLVEVCANLGPSTQATALTQAIRDHNRHSTALWSGRGNVLEPYTSYRLRFVTNIQMRGDYSAAHDLVQLAYFQTGGPPGLSTLTKPAEPPQPADTEFTGGLADLSLYVEQTIPPTVPETGELPLLPRPVYRGYDVGVLFNEDYVDLMYRLAGRDLSLLLYDRNNQPVRDQTGRLVVMDNPWGVNEQLSFNAQETPWITLMDGSPCVDPIDLDSVPRDQTLRAAHEAQILDPDTLYDARLMPLLAHEDFSRIPAGTLGRWQVTDLVTTGAPSHWEIEEFVPKSYRVIQTSGIGVGGTWLGTLPTLTWLGTLLVLGNHPGVPATDSSQPPIWSDCRISLYLRSSQDGTIGAAFRYADAGNFYLFTMDRPNGAHRLIRVAGGGFTILAEDQITYDLNRDYHLVVEAIADSLRIYLDDALLFDVTDATIASGGLALQCGTCAGAAFSDIQVHDFSKAARSVYHFPFTTSAFVDFFHHLHSFDDECWPGTCTLPDADLAALDAHSASEQNSAVSDDEARAFERLADNTLGTSANQTAVRTELTRIERPGGGDAAAFLLRTPEPIDWMRTSVSWAFSGELVPPPFAPGPVKLVAASLGSQQPESENVTLHVRDAIDLTGYRIEKRDLPAVAGTEPPPVSLDDPTSTWISIYEFGDENVIAAGTKVVVNSGNPDNPPPAVPRVSQRFRAPAGAPGDVQLTANTVDLRLLNSQGEVVHARRFLNDMTSYSPVAFRVLRKADGTAFFLLPTGFPSARFSPGTYQMRLEFRRDNIAIDPNSLVLSAAGETVPEVTILDVPSSTIQTANLL